MSTFFIKNKEHWHLLEGLYWYGQTYGTLPIDQYSELTYEKLHQYMSEFFYGKEPSARQIRVYPVNPEAFQKELNKVMKEDFERYGHQGLRLSF